MSAVEQSQMTDEQKRMAARILRHAVGVGSRVPGYRNRYHCSVLSEDYKILRKLEEIGLASCVDQSGGGSFVRFSLTRAGCEEAGLDETEILRALEE